MSTSYEEVPVGTIVAAVVRRTLDLLDMQAEADGTGALSPQERELAETVSALAATVTVLVLREQRAVITP